MNSEFIQIVLDEIIDNIECRIDDEIQKGEKLEDGRYYSASFPDVSIKEIIEENKEDAAEYFTEHYKKEDGFAEMDKESYEDVLKNPQNYEDMFSYQIGVFFIDYISDKLQEYINYRIRDAK